MQHTYFARTTSLPYVIKYLEGHTSYGAHKNVYADRCQPIHFMGPHGTKMGCMKQLSHCFLSQLTILQSQQDVASTSVGLHTYSEKNKLISSYVKVVLRVKAPTRHTLNSVILRDTYFFIKHVTCTVGECESCLVEAILKCTYKV